MSKSIKGYEISNTGKSAEIKLIRGFDWWADNFIEFTRQIDNLIEQGVDIADVYINSPGGDMFHANEIINQLNRFKQVRVKLGALVASAATIVSSSFSDVEASANTMFMIHDPIWQPFIQHEEDFDNSKKLYTNLLNDAVRVYKSKTNKPEDDIKSKMKATTWMNVQEAMAYGFIDRVGSKEDTMLPEDSAGLLNKMGVKVPQILNQLQSINSDYIQMKEIAKKLGLPENATLEQITNAIEVLDKQRSEGIKALGVLATQKGFNAEKIMNLAKADFETTLSMVIEQEAPAKPGNQPAGNSSTNTPEAPENTGDDGKRFTSLFAGLDKVLKNAQGQAPVKEWEDYTPEELIAFEKEKPEEFQALFNKTFGK